MVAQVTCLENMPGAGKVFMGYYDALDREEKAALQQSKFNLCVMCYITMYRHHHYAAIDAVKEMENDIQRQSR